MDIEFIKKYETRAPRYTSYPPANFFTEKVDNEIYKQQIVDSNSRNPQNISLYVHIPFCPQLCNFCGCTTFFNSDVQRVKRYVSALETEIKNVASLLDTKRPVTQIHWGGGTPNALKTSVIDKIINIFAKYFNISVDAEIAMECNPAYMDLNDIKDYNTIGFNRLSLGIQDFDEKILNIINRKSSKLPVNQLIEQMHRLGMKGINLDLVYGLPCQTENSFVDSVNKAIETGADRIVTFSYAHVPWVKPAQKVLESKGLPTAEQKISMFSAANDVLTKKGYFFIGMDHYCKPNDELSYALQNGMLKRNFQGYCTSRTTGQVYGFGATSISQLFGSYIQNIKNPEDYMQSIETNGFAVSRGYVLDFNQIICREVIGEVMCNGKLNFAICADRLSVDVQTIKKSIDYDVNKFLKFINDGILTANEDGLELKRDAIFAVRNVAVLLDPMMKNNEKMFSKTI